MQMTMVGHASVVLDYGDVVVLTDPWLRGTAFNDSWSPWPEPELDPALLERVTHLFISHEHPDHLSIPTLKSLPPERRAALTVLYQQPWSPVVPDFLRAQGFREVRELVHGRFERLSDRVEVCVYQVGHEDAALVARGDGLTVLDLNDCKPSPGVMRRLRALTGPIDVLLDQFSIAGWAGNPGDEQRLARQREEAFGSLVEHVDGLAPRQVVPFASFTRFCHEENAWMNAGIVEVEEVGERLGWDRVVVLAPGDTWTPGTPPPTDAAREVYRRAAKERASLPLKTNPPAAYDDVLAAARRRAGELRADYHRVLLRQVPPVVFALTDLRRAVRLDLGGPGSGAREVPYPDQPTAEAGPCVVRLSSQAALATFTQRWGLPTLLISGRFVLEGAEKPFARLKQVGAAYSTGLATRSLARHAASRRGRHLLTRRWRNLPDDYLRR